MFPALFITMTAAPSSPSAYLEAVPVGSFVRINELPGTKAAASIAASRAAQRGELVPVRRGLYFKGAPTRDGRSAGRREAGPHGWAWAGACPDAVPGVDRVGGGGSSAWTTCPWRVTC